MTGREMASVSWSTLGALRRLARGELQRLRFGDDVAADGLPVTADELQAAVAELDEAVDNYQRGKA